MMTQVSEHRAGHSQRQQRRRHQHSAASADRGSGDYCHVLARRRLPILFFILQALTYCGPQAVHAFPIHLNSGNHLMSGGWPRGAANPFPKWAPSHPWYSRNTHDQESADDIQQPNPTASMEALDALVPRHEILALSKKKSNLQGALQLAWHVACYLAAACCFPPIILSTVAMAFVASFFFHSLHETVHRTAFRSKLVNDVVAQIFGFLCVRPACHYRYYHWQHHKYTGNVELDSELQPGSFLDFPIDSISRYIWYMTGIPFWIDAWSTLGRHAMGHCPEIYLKDKTLATKRVILEGRIYIALYAMIGTLSFGWPAARNLVWKFWMLPTLLGQPFLRFYLLAEHQGRKKTPLIYENTRTMLTNAVYKKLAWNMPYHIEHHAWPSVPFFQLPKAHETLLQGGARENNKTILWTLGELVVPAIGANRNGEKGRMHHCGYIAFHVEFLKRLWNKE